MQHLFLAYLALAPALGVLGLPALRAHAAWLGTGGVPNALMNVLIALAALAVVVYLGLSNELLQPPKKAWLLLLFILDTPLLMALSGFARSRLDFSGLGWDGLVEICGVMIGLECYAFRELAGRARLHGWRDTLRARSTEIKLMLLFFGPMLIGPLVLVALFLESWVQATFVLPAIAWSGYTYLRVMHKREVQRQDAWGWIVVGTFAVLIAFGVQNVVPKILL